MLSLMSPGFHYSVIPQYCGCVDWLTRVISFFPDLEVDANIENVETRHHAMGYVN